jgi:DNA-binding NarL/FixJ family response regulator
MSELKSFGSDVEDAISRVRVPAYLIDKHGIIRWLNPAAQKLVGDVRGVFGQIKDVEEAEPPPPPHPHLTPRQSEVLRLLDQGRSTEQMATDLHLSIDTVRNHIRGLLRALGVHSRLEAVAVARDQVAVEHRDQAFAN